MTLRCRDGKFLRDPDEQPGQLGSRPPVCLRYDSFQ